MLVCFVSIMHIFWGILLLWNQEAISTTATEVFRHLIAAYDVRAVVYIVSGLLPAILLRWPGSLAGLLSVMPQQVLLLMSGISAIVAITSGHYADGTVRSVVFIAMDQGIYIVLGVLHAFESLDRYHERHPHGGLER